MLLALWGLFVVYCLPLPPGHGVCVRARVCVHVCAHDLAHVDRLFFLKAVCVHAPRLRAPADTPGAQCENVCASMVHIHCGMCALPLVLSLTPRTLTALFSYSAQRVFIFSLLLQPGICCHPR